jgi:hypothetical protein
MTRQTTVVATQWLSSDHVGTPTDTKATFAGPVFSVRFVPRSYKQGKLLSWVSEEEGGELVQLVRGLLWFSRSELLLWETGSWAREYSGTQRKGNVVRWKPLPGSG